jgi:hypothetical protein
MYTELKLRNINKNKLNIAITPLKKFQNIFLVEIKESSQ